MQVDHVSGAPSRVGSQPYQAGHEKFTKKKHSSLFVKIMSNETNNKLDRPANIRLATKSLQRTLAYFQDPELKKAFIALTPGRGW